AVALAAVETFFAADTRPLEPDLVRQAFAAVTSPGRLERVRVEPTIILDTAHNPHGMRATVAALTEDFAFGTLVGAVSVFHDKDARGILAALEPVLAAVVVTRNSSPRAMPAAQLGAVAAEVFGDDRVRVVVELPDAIDTAVALLETLAAARAHPERAGLGVLVTGSVVTVADARRLFVR
ncbi:MAG: dihydrofolate synthase, partial [Sporichthyaceae bacterium]|nr:dihydrofolate synthase [Sporichthyaceae bacterium]